MKADHWRVQFIVELLVLYYGGEYFAVRIVVYVRVRAFITHAGQVPVLGIQLRHPEVFYQGLECALVSLWVGRDAHHCL